MPRVEEDHRNVTDSASTEPAAAAEPRASVPPAAVDGNIPPETEAAPADPHAPAGDGAPVAPEGSGAPADAAPAAPHAHAGDGAPQAPAADAAAAADVAPRPIPMPAGPYVPASRAEMLKRNLVIRRRRNKGKADDHEDLPEEKKTRAQRASKFLDRFDFATGAIMDSEKLTKGVVELGDGSLGDVDKYFGYASLGLSGLSTLNGLYKTHNNRKKIAKSKSARRRDQAFLSTLGGISSFFSSASGIASKSLKLFGDDSAVQKDAMSYLGLTSSMLGFMSSGLNMAAAMTGRNENRRIAKDASKWTKQAEDTEKTVPDYERRISEDIKHDGNDSIRSGLKQERTDFKAKKYGMGMAQAFNKEKGDQPLRGKFGMVRSGLSLASSAVKTFTGKTGFWGGLGGKITSLALDGISTALKYGGKAREKSNELKAEAKTKEMKLTFVNDYIKNKQSRLDVSTADMFQDVPDNERDNFGENTLSEQEKKRLIIARLGLDIEITDEELSDDDKLNAFKLLAIRRARNILNASEATRKEMLGTLGLDRNAGESDIVKAITGE